MLIAIILFLSGMSGCTGIQPTLPNLPFEGPYPLSLETLKKTNPLLRAELGKLPESIDGISQMESNALEKIASVHAGNPTAFDEAFTIMYQVGHPAVRKYCTLLQALFWYALDHDTQQISTYLEQYDGVYIDPEYPFLEMITVSLLLSDIWNFKDKNRWGDPEAVIERLNAPELFEYWFSVVFRYDFSKKYKRAPVWAQPAETSIKTGKGVCYDAANLARVCLLKAGYTAKGLNVVLSAGARVKAHSVCVMEVQKQTEVGFMIVGDTRKPGTIDIPNVSIREMAREMAREYGVSLLRYNVGFPGFSSFN